MAGTIERNSSNLHDADTGVMIGYKNPITGKEVALDSAAVQSLVSGAGVARNRSVVVGDSRVQNSFTDNFLASFTRQFNNRGWWGWLQALSGNYWNLVQAAGVTADTIANVNTRFASANQGQMFSGSNPSAGTQIGISPFAPDWIFAELGINNIGAGQSLAAMTAEAETFISLCEATGAKLVWLNEGAVGASTAGYGQAYFNRIRRWNDWLMRRQATSTALLVVDVWPVTVNPTSATGVARTGYTYDDAVHPGPYAARLRAEAIWAAVQARWGIRRMEWQPVSTYDVWNSTTAADVPNRLADPLVQAATAAATGTGNSGTFPGGYLAGNCGSGATCAYSVVAHPSGYGNCVQMDVTFSATPGSFALMSTARNEANFVAGDIFRFGADVIVQGPAGAALTAADNLLAVKLNAWVVDGSANNYFSNTLVEASNADQTQVGSHAIAPVTWPITIPAGVTRVQGQVYAVGKAAGGCRILIGRFAHFGNGGPVG